MPHFFITATDQQGERICFNWEAADADSAYRKMESRGFTEIVVESNLKEVEWAPLYYVTATDKTGKREITSVYAENSLEVFQFLESDGFTDIILHTNDASAVINGQMILDLNAADNLIPLSLLQTDYQTVGKLFRALMKCYYRKLRWIMLIVFGVLVFFLWNRGLLLSVEGLIGLIAFLLWPAGSAYMIARSSFSRCYKQLLDASFWGRWSKVLALAPKLKGLLPDFEIDSRAALALAAQGRLDEGLELLKPHENSSRAPGWIYWLHLAGLYLDTDDRKNYQACIRRAVADGSDLPIVQLDHVAMLFNSFDDFSQVELQAKQIIAQLEEQRLDELCNLILLRHKGTLHLLQGNRQAAKDYFLKCQQAGTNLLDSLPQVFHLMEPGIEIVLDENQAYLAITLAELGEKAEAAELFQRVLPRLQALGYQALIDRYKVASTR